MVEMIAQQMVGAMQSLADWWDLHRKVPKEEVVQAAMDFAWIGQERISRGERWAALGRLGRFARRHRRATR